MPCRGCIRIPKLFKHNYNNLDARIWVQKVILKRYLRKNYANGNSLGIDANAIFIGGYSAGAITAIHSAFVDTITDLSSDKLKEIISKYDGLIVRSATKATKDIIEAGHNLKIIGVHR